MYEELIEILIGYCTENVPITTESLKNTLRLTKENNQLVMSDSMINNIGTPNTRHIYFANERHFRVSNFLMARSLRGDDSHTVLYVTKDNMIYIMGITETPYSHKLICENINYKEVE